MILASGGHFGSHLGFLWILIRYKDESTSIGFLGPGNMGLDTKINHIGHFLGQLLTIECRMAAILKNGGHIEFFSWLALFSIKVTYKEHSCQISCLYHKVHDSIHYLLYYGGAKLEKL